jgi:hypothetical protein
MKFLNSVCLSLAAVGIMAGCGSSDKDLFKEVTSIQEKAGSAALASTPDSILGYFQGERGQLLKVESDSVTLASKDKCEDGTNIADQVRIPIQKIANTEAGVLFVARTAKLSFKECPGMMEEFQEDWTSIVLNQVEFFKNWEYVNGVITLNKGAAYLGYHVNDGKIYDRGLEPETGFYESDVTYTKLFDLQ